MVGGSSSFVVVIIDSQGERDHEEDICNGQVGHVDGCACERLRHPAETPQRCGIADYAEYEDHAVGDLVVGEAVAGVHRAVGLNRYECCVMEIHDHFQSKPASCSPEPNEEPVFGERENDCMVILIPTGLNMI